MSKSGQEKKDTGAKPRASLTEKSITIKLESQVLSKVEDLCNRIEEKLSVIKDGELESKMKNQLLVCQKYAELMSDCVENCLSILNGNEEEMNWQLSSELRDVIKKSIEKSL